jgi:hypothetical protein
MTPPGRELHEFLVFLSPEIFKYPLAIAICDQLRASLQKGSVRCFHVAHFWSSFAMESTPEGYV